MIKINPYSQWIDLSWPQSPEDSEPFFVQLAAELAWPEPVFAAPGQPEDVLRALGVGVGDYILLPNLSSLYWAAAIKAIGADCILIDAHPATWQLDLDLLEEFLMNYTMLNEQDALILKKDSRPIRAVVVPHLLGGLCDLDRLQFIARRFHLSFGEDITQALGSRWKGQPAGSFGAANYCSFTHNPILPFGAAVWFSREAALMTSATSHVELFSPMAGLANYLGRRLVPKVKHIISNFQATERHFRQTLGTDDHRHWMSLEADCTGNGLSAAFRRKEISGENPIFERLLPPIYRRPPFNKCLYIRREDWAGKIYDEGCSAWGLEHGAWSLTIR